MNSLLSWIEATFSLIRTDSQNFRVVVNKGAWKEGRLLISCIRCSGAGWLYWSRRINWLEYRYALFSNLRGVIMETIPYTKRKSNINQAKLVCNCEEVILMCWSKIDSRKVSYFYIYFISDFGATVWSVIMDLKLMWRRKRKFHKTRYTRRIIIYGAVFCKCVLISLTFVYVLENC